MLLLIIFFKSKIPPISSQTLTHHQDMKTNFSLFLTLFLTLGLLAQSPVISNKNFSFGTYGRAGIGYGLGTEAAFPQSLNLNGMGSIGGRFEENDYLELATTHHCKP